MSMCVWCQENPAAPGDVLCAPCKRDEEDTVQEIQTNKDSYDGVVDLEAAMDEDFQLGDDEELPF